MKTSEILMAIARSKHGQWLGSAEHISMSGRSPARTTIQLLRAVRQRSNSIPRYGTGPARIRKDQ